MSEDVPAYTSREFVCQRCGAAFVPTREELEILEALEREFALAPEKCSATCRECQGRTQ